MEEIKRQEEKEKEEKIKRMKIKYIESMRKRKEDEEKLRQIKLKQEMELKAINELKNKKKLQEEKLLMLMEGKLNKQEIKNYRKSIENEDIQENNISNKYKLPFDLATDVNNNKSESQRGINNIKDEFYEKNYKYNYINQNEDNLNENDINNQINFVEKENNYRINNKKSSNQSITT